MSLEGDLGSAFCSRTLEGHGLSLCGPCFPQALVWMGPETRGYRVKVRWSVCGPEDAVRMAGVVGVPAELGPSPSSPPGSLICHCHACPLRLSAISRGPSGDLHRVPTAVKSAWASGPHRDRCVRPWGPGRTSGAGKHGEHLAGGFSLRRDLEAGRACLVNQEWKGRPPRKIRNDDF